MIDRERIAALRQGAEKGASFVAIKRDDLLWLLDQADKKSSAKPSHVEPAKQPEPNP
jgi:hypothetical protein